MARLDPRDGDPWWCVDRVISVAGIDYEFRRYGHALLVDPNGNLVSFGRPASRKMLWHLLDGKEEEMKRFLIARAVRGGE